MATFVNSVSPDLPEEFELTEFEFNVLDFLPTNDDWISFLKCLAEDNVEDLKAFSKHINWENFLRSCDINGTWIQCSPDFTSSISLCNHLHPFPSNPFSVAMFYNAKKCLLFMSESGVDFSNLAEHGFNAYHNLMGAISFITTQRFETDRSPEVLELISFFHCTLFTQKQQGKMLRMKCHHGMAPMGWGVFLGLANYVEYIMYYHSPNSVLKTEAIGITEHITLDLSEFVGENPSYFTSPLCILLDLYGESMLPQVKKIGLFQHNFIWKQWVDRLFISNKPFIYFMLFITFMLTASTVIFTGPGVNDYLRHKQEGRVAALPIGTITVLAAWVGVALMGVSFGTVGLFRKEYYRHQVNYPNWPRQYYKDLLVWFLPNIVSFPVSIFLIWLYCDAERGVAMFGRFIYTISGLCNIILLLSSVCLIVCYLRLVSPLTTLMSSFFNSIGAFSLFIIFYLALMGIFARMFQSSFIFSSSSNTTTSRPDNLTGFLSAFYMTFLTSLNIVDSTVFIPKDDRIDLNVTHIFYILFVPVLFINFVVGILSSVVSQVLEHDIENRYMLMLSTVEFAERTLAPLRMMFKPRSIVLRICEPLSAQSKLLKFNKNSIALQPSHTSQRPSPPEPASGCD